MEEMSRFVYVLSGADPTIIDRLDGITLKPGFYTAWPGRPSDTWAKWCRRMKRIAEALERGEFEDGYVPKLRSGAEVLVSDLPPSDHGSSDGDSGSGDSTGVQ